MGGHAFLAFVEITGGAWHIATKQVGEYTNLKVKDFYLQKLFCHGH